jgi:hypothetical protein
MWKRKALSLLRFSPHPVDPEAVRPQGRRGHAVGNLGVGQDLTVAITGDFMTNRVRGYRFMDELYVKR